MIRINLDLVMAKRGIGLTELAKLIGITPANLSRFKNGRCTQIKISTLESLCRALHCTPGDLIGFVEE